MSRVWPLQRRRVLLFSKAARCSDTISSNLTQFELDPERLTTWKLSKNTICRFERPEQSTMAGVRTLGLAQSLCKG